MYKIIDGNNACANIAYKFSELSFIYPITPSSPMASAIEELKNKQEEMLNKQNELEEKNNELKNEIEKVKISKINNKKTTVTSRSGSTIRDTNTTTN